ncbi:MAG: methyl-accepting chemotaxis protein [Geothrix sp.]|nr:MAG: methyl-accepting chemotaxis protein [Geothrix sp.]
MAEHRQHTQDEVSDVVHPIKDRLATGLQGSQAIVKEINQVMSSMQMLALNASIEAAKAGTHGRGFAVVADQMGKSVDTVRALTQEIESVNANIIQVSTQIDSILEMLR